MTYNQGMAVLFAVMMLLLLVLVVSLNLHSRKVQAGRDDARALFEAMSTEELAQAVIDAYEQPDSCMVKVRPWAELLAERALESERKVMRLTRTLELQRGEMKRQLQQVRLTL